MRRLGSRAALFVAAWTVLAAAPPPEALPNAHGLAEIYQRRAYYGAPPPIPHPVEASVANEPRRCLACHGASTYVPSLNAYAPTTPHQELSSCTQCHVPQNHVPPFRGSSFVALSAPPLPQRALPTSPPPMPHRLDMRRACTSCHANAATAKEIVCKHPELVNCEQCHVPANAADPHFSPTRPANEATP